ncbi:hypothetical protein AJ80_05480 [Polytolypa hystricis UAMH7299]|uniref:tRNA (guanine(46)-N(7))-methyltransferase n=1 Tax=Polytolypa hystricis (strain UAMH7299) TaxID=1447883 RepID=A0A2B7Y333_POLH7|nr:hypothetical protein AJ80_05480 [Polytolypa hystricis UAMH7299]
MPVLQAISAFLGIIAVCTIIRTLVEIANLLIPGVGIFSKTREVTAREARLEEGKAKPGAETQMCDTFWSRIFSCWKNDRSQPGPPCPQSKSPKINWSALYPEFAVGKRITKRVDIVAMGKGSDNLLLNLATRMPDTLMTVLETRPRAVEDTKNRIAALRNQSSGFGNPAPTANTAPYSNIVAILASGLKTLPNYFTNNQLGKVFICFPGPEVTRDTPLNPFNISEAYANIVRPGGMLYTVTDAQEMSEFLVEKFGTNGPNHQHALWEIVPECDWEADECVAIMVGETWKITGPGTYVAVWKRREIYL